MEKMIFEKKPNVAFICVHNSCRSQMAEALGKLFGREKMNCYSAGTEVKDRINQDAVRLIKEIYGVDMEKSQHSKLLKDIPKVDVAIFMGCNVKCPNFKAEYMENWGLDDPSGMGDEFFRETIRKIEENILSLRDRIEIK